MTSTIKTRAPRTRTEKQVFAASFRHLAHLAVYEGVTTLGEHIWKAGSRFEEAEAAAERVSSELGHAVCVI